MIIEFQPYLEHRRNLKSTVLSRHADSQVVKPKLRDRQAEPNLFRTPFDDAPDFYREGFKRLWVNVHQAIGHRDCSPIDTERRLGMFSNQALYKIEGWPERQKSFLWRKYGEGCVSQGDLADLTSSIDSQAFMACLKQHQSV
ncbi:hypothetical protein QO021_29860 (plasmid) [Pseudomonas amygdali pv. lachrymans]|uniref:hypothetical protein n=1 Tax=Pseudomonas amygdali TaxID=47877 RepID=UPI0006B8C8B2|nr:hypothetical protein [Pseudomonas amygdali]RMM39190.1 hypothetical protein ALQ79_200246 [Pseudomonas amygdali pv. lachrymans]WIO61294.1 hypothetical protein QO021_29860 [Pseudomonas amygdali pv. lachrymans]